MIAKRFSGLMNNDDEKQDVLPNQHIAATNGRFTGGQNGLTFQNIKGNYEIPNASLPAGTNECIGSFFDSVNQRIIWFNYNSNGDNGIYQLALQSDTVTKIFLCGTDSATDILNFNLDYPVHSCSLVYRTTGDGDLLYWTDGYNRPKYINIDTVATLAPFTANMITAAKISPYQPPSFPNATGTNDVFGYFSDSSINYNSVRNRFFRFAYRWTFKNKEKSTLSPISTVPLPWLIDPNNQGLETIYNYIKVIVYSPNEEDYQSIELFGQESINNVWGDFFLIEKFDRDDYSIPVNSSFTYNFYNNSVYTFLAPEESDLYFDWLPDKANTQELLNGNVIIYAGITEGYPNLQRSEVDVVIVSALKTLDPVLVTIPNPAPVFKWGTNVRFGLVYNDQFGKSNGVISFLSDSIDTTDFAVTTPSYPGQSPSATIQVPEIFADINHLPPSWANTFQWVRADLTPKFVQWVTSDYQTDINYLYLCIENLIEMNNKSKFLPSYEYTPGDRVRILASYGGDNNTTAYSIQNDFPIYDVVKRIMTSPASDGSFLKVPRPASYPSAGYVAKMLIEIYTPVANEKESQQLYYEWGQEYGIYESGGVRYHDGQIQNQTISQPARFSWTNGDVYIKRRAFYSVLPISDSSTYNYFDAMDANWNDYVASAINANGRGWVINENAATEYNPVLLRWGGAYQPGTNINALNRFRPADLDEIDRAKGDIRRLKSRDRILRVFQDRAVGQFGVYARFIQNNQGQAELVTTNEIITTNNINYYQGVFGLCGYPTNLVSTTIADYFTDVVTGRGIRLSGDGVTDLGVLYKGQYTLSSYVTPYNKELLRANGKIAKVMAFFDFFNKEYHTVLQAGTGGGTTTTDKHFSFNEARKGYCCDAYDYHPEWATGANDMIYAWKDGVIYKHDSSTYCNFFGQQFGCDITVVFNDNLLEKKSWNAISEVANAVWYVPELQTNTLSYGTTPQQSSITAAEFRLLEQMPSATIKRDANSRGGKWNGGFMKGNYLTAKFRVENASDFVSLSELIVRFTDSPRTDK